MVVQIAKTFNLSLDQLILGDNTMTDKLVNDGSEVKKAKFNLLSIIFLTLGAMCFWASVIKMRIYNVKHYTAAETR